MTDPIESRPLESISQLSTRLARTPNTVDLAALGRQATALAERAKQAMAQEASGSDPTGSVTATVRADGSVVSVYISPYAIRDLAAGEVGQACVEAVAAARVEVSNQLAEWLRTIGHDVNDGEAAG